MHVLVCFNCNTNTRNSYTVAMYFKSLVKAPLITLGYCNSNLVCLPEKPKQRI